MILGFAFSYAGIMQYEEYSGQFLVFNQLVSCLLGL